MENQMGTDENEVLAYIEKYSIVFNALAQEVLTRTNKTAEGASASAPGMFDPQKLASLLNGDIKVDSNKLIQQQMQYMQKQAVLWQQASKAMLSQNLAANAEKSDSAAKEPKAKTDDRRFSHSDWEQNPVFHYIKESYLVNSDMLSNMIDAIEFSDERAAKQAKFFTRQYVNSLAPTNFILTNPEVCEEVLKTKGENLVKGMQNFLEDLERSSLEAFKMRQSASSAFTISENLATTPAKVIFQNELIQHIQYASVLFPAIAVLY
jgi:polyhydroxyalkanoate synthase